MSTGINPFQHGQSSVQPKVGVAGQGPISPKSSRSKQLEDLKSQVQSGTYVVNVSKLAQTILASGALNQGK